MTKDQVRVGVRVISRANFSGVDAGTEGVIDELYDGGCMVAWDLKDHPLPPGYAAYDGKPIIQTGILRDGFGYRDDEPDELAFLTVKGKGLYE